MERRLGKEMSTTQDGEKEAASVSSLPDYAQIFMFLRNFGSLLAFPPVSLSDLENFFLTGVTDDDNPVVAVHWRLLTSVTRRESQKEWRKMAARFACRSGVVAESMPYSKIPLKERVEVFKLACEGQFDCNLPFRAELKKLNLTSDKPVGSDQSGRRYWLLRDSTHDVRLYQECGYAELPPKPATWSLLARSVDELGEYIENFTDNKSEKNQEEAVKVRKEGEGESEMMEVDVSAPVVNEDQTGGTPKPQPLSEGSKVTSDRWSSGGKGLSREGRGTRKKRAGKRGGKVAKKEPSPAQDGGCFLCGFDNNYQKMLLCDSCDKEWHMYCIYPRLWAVPHGEWACPLCNERNLVATLKAAHTELAVARYQFEKVAERKQRSVMRLQRSGLLLQNIILSESSTERSRRARKVVNYAELNDVHLPPLGPKDFVTSGNRSTTIESTTGGANPLNPLSTRASRRLRGLYEEPEQSSKNSAEVTSAPHDRLPSPAIPILPAEEVSQLSPQDAGNRELVKLPPKDSPSTTSISPLQPPPPSRSNHLQKTDVVIPDYPVPVGLTASLEPVYNGSWIDPASLHRSGDSGIDDNNINQPIGELPPPDLFN